MPYSMVIQFQVLKIRKLGQPEYYCKDRTITWSGDFTNKNNASLDFKIGDEVDLASPILLVEGKTVFNTGSKALFSYVGSNINDIVNKDIILIQSNGGMSGPIDVAQNEITVVSNLSPLLAQTDSWVTTTDPIVNGE